MFAYPKVGFSRRLFILFHYLTPCTILAFNICPCRYPFLLQLISQIRGISIFNENFVGSNVSQIDIGYQCLYDNTECLYITISI